MRLTYLIGAGASAEAIPVVSKFQERLKDITKLLCSKVNLLDKEFPNSKDPDHTPMKALVSLISDLEDLSQNIQNQSVDSYAKSLYDTYNGSPSDKFFNLKRVLVCYYLIEQSINLSPYNNIDSRYIPWLNSITTRKEGIPFIKKNIDILSWNYDIQIELGLMRISNNLLDNPFHELIEVFPRSGTKEKNKNNKLIKLNGTAGLHYSFGSNSSFVKAISNELNKNEIMNILSTYNNYYYDYGSNKVLLFYSWEKDDSNNAVKLALEVAKDCTDLIVIGYSFPDYNRKIDYQILSSKTNLKRISIQEKSDDAYRSIEFRIKEIRDDILIERIPFTDPFYIPTEYLIND